MQSLLPSHVIFYRTPISTSVEDMPEPPPSRPRRAASSAAAELDAASEPLPKPPKPQSAKIFGSVSTADVADSFKAVLDQTEEGSRVVLGAEDIKFLGTEQMEAAESQETGIEGGRIKALGDFQVEARVKGGDTVIRTVSVRAQEDNEE
jgi:ribosomal protein L9